MLSPGNAKYEIMNFAELSVQTLEESTFFYCVEMIVVKST